jgi:hypothetical protein
MNAKDTAIKIYDKFKNQRLFIEMEPSNIDCTMVYLDVDAVKDCSIIAIDLIIETIKNQGEYSSRAQIEWWQMVKDNLPSNTPF